MGKYALRLAMAPTLAVLGIGVGQMLGGAVFAEVVFARPGLGTLVYDAISARNYPVVQAAVLVVVGLYALANLCVDAARQRGGIGRALLAETKRLVGPRCMVLLVSVPSAVGYYARLGMEGVPDAFLIRRDG